MNCPYWCKIYHESVWISIQEKWIGSICMSLIILLPSNDMQVDAQVCTKTCVKWNGNYFQHLWTIQMSCYHKCCCILFRVDLFLGTVTSILSRSVQKWNQIHFFVEFFVFMDHRIHQINYGISEHAVYRLNTLLTHYCYMILKKKHAVLFQKTT